MSSISRCLSLLTMTVGLSPLTLSAEEGPKPNLVFILADDLGESKNLVDQHPDMAAELHEPLNAWESAVSKEE